MIQTVKYNVDDVIYSTSENVAKSQSAGVELILKDKLFRILDLTTTVNAYYYKLDGFRYVINDQTVTGRSDENFSWDARMLASFILPYDISLQATGNYRSRTVITQGYRKPSASLDLGLRKSFLNKQFALSVIGATCSTAAVGRLIQTRTASNVIRRTGATRVPTSH